MDTTGKHLIVEYWGCPREALLDQDTLQMILVGAARVVDATVVDSVVREFPGGGLSGVVVLEGSHFSIHTWPEAGYAAADFYVCGNCDPWKAHIMIKNGLGAQREHTLLIERGLSEFHPSFDIIQS